MYILYIYIYIYLFIYTYTQMVEYVLSYGIMPEIIS